MSNAISLDFPRAYGSPLGQAVFRLQHGDFIVREDLGFELSGEGEHLYLFVKKVGENTSWVAEKLAAFFKLNKMDVSYCGKKDRRAETYQWFSLYLPGLEAKDEEVDWAQLPLMAGFNGEVLERKRHPRKLRRGMHKANHFTIYLRDSSDAKDLMQRLEKIERGGVPNYFGEQRFGRDGSNLDLARRWFEQGEKIKNRGKRAMVMSAARAYIFNQVLAARVRDDNWREEISGDPLIEGGASGPLWGRGRAKSSERCLALENQVLEAYAPWLEQLEHLGLQQERRALGLAIGRLDWEFEQNNLRLNFSLPPGQYATALLREICELTTPEIYAIDESL